MSEKRIKLSKPATCQVGEFYVAYKLSALGFHVGILRGNNPSVDLLITNTTGERTLAIQVKTVSDAKRYSPKRRPDEGFWRWNVGKRGKTLHSDDLFYVFVDLQNEINSLPTTFIVPSKIVYAQMKRVDHPGTIFNFVISERDKKNSLERWNILENAMNSQM